MNRGWTERMEKRSGRFVDKYRNGEREPCKKICRDGVEEGMLDIEMTS